MMNMKPTLTFIGKGAGSALAEPLTFTIDASENGKRLISVVLNRYTHLRPPMIYQAYRKRNIRVNGHRLRQDSVVFTGDQVVMFLPDRVQQPDRKYDIHYEDEHVLICRKKPGLLVHTGAAARHHESTLIDLLREERRNPDLCLCHRLDRQTGGLIMIAGNTTLCRSVQDQMRQNRVIKRYTCLVRGIPRHGTPVRCADGTSMRQLTGWLEKDERQSTVYIHDQKRPGDLKIQTCYQITRIFHNVGPDHEDVSELIVELVTGRTHQIRSHLASIGHPIVGDGKYGRNEFNRSFLADGKKVAHQQLWATHLIFSPVCDGPLKKLAGRTIKTAAEFSWDGYRMDND